MKILAMNPTKDFISDLEIYLRANGFSDLKLQLLLERTSQVSLDRFIDILFEEGIHFLRVNPSDWVRNPLYPAIVSSSVKPTVKSAEFIDEFDSALDSRAPSVVYCLPEVSLVQALQGRRWFSVVKSMFRLAGKSFIFLLLLLLIETATSFSLAFQFQKILLLIQESRPTMAMALIIGWALLRLVLMLSNAVTGYFEFKLLSRLKSTSLPGVLAGLLNTKENEGEDPTGRAFVAIDSLGESINAAITLALKLPIQIFSLALFIGFLSYHDYRLPLLTFVFFGLSVLIKNFSGKRQSVLRERNLEESKKFMSTMSSLVGNFGVILSHGVQSWALKIWSHDLEGISKSKNKLIWYGHVFDFFNNLLVHTIFFLSFFLVSGPWKIAPDNFALVGTISLIVSFTFSSLEDATDSILKVWDLNAFLKALPGAVRSKLRQKNSPTPAPSGCLFTLTNAEFWYGGNLVLKNVNLEIPSKQMVGFVGDNGSGKTTLIKSIMGALEPKAGEYRCHFLEGEIVCMTKFDRLFPGTLLDNLLLEPGYEEDEVSRIISYVCMDEWLKDQPLGLQVMIGEKGIGLSGGENVRLLLARALLRRPRVLILDEATASLDLETESAILKQLKGFEHGLESVIIVSHRKETLKQVDRIYNFKNQAVSLHED